MRLWAKQVLQTLVVLTLRWEGVKRGPGRAELLGWPGRRAEAAPTDPSTVPTQPGFFKARGFCCKLPGLVDQRFASSFSPSLWF